MISRKCCGRAFCLVATLTVLMAGRLTVGTYDPRSRDIAAKRGDQSDGTFVNPVPWRLLINACGNGFMRLNGHDIGRHWDAGPQRELYLPNAG